MGQIQFSVSDEAEDYLTWLAQNVLFEQTASKAARHIFLKGLEVARKGDGVTAPLPNKPGSEP